MQRRTYLAAVVAAAGSAAGCTNRGTPTDTPASTPSATPTPAPPRITDRSFERRENCDESGAATIAVEGTAVVVEGCIVGKDGCQRPMLDRASYDADADELRVRVATETASDADVCTQQLVDLPYTATVTFENGLPGTTTVVHDGVDGETQVARAETGSAD